ncbi:hypothetical protein BUALT_Bualt18G0090300 [Buddleja alternifolia]|uniref:Peptidase C14 caspase domain-containing protein n=1 Tax=Buddleja alternifolia TaxID=168488 RepID=A0AAV6W4P0_9LAMI|nr:hypothetical protein BUALT_Bualt18G0090300 [Buddleja alternifolia]
MAPRREAPADQSIPSFDEQLVALTDTIRVMQADIAANGAATKNLERESQLRETESAKRHDSSMTMLSTLLQQMPTNINITNPNSPPTQTTYHVGSTSNPPIFQMPPNPLGHGTRLPAETGGDECIVPTNMNLITDNDFRDLVDQVPEGCQITIVSNSCHSGGLIDEAKEQIGESFKENREDEEENSEFGSGFKSRGMYSSEDEGENESEEYAYMKDKSLSLSLFMEVLQEKTGNDDIDIGKLRPILFDVFGDDASPKVKKFMNLILNKLQDDGNDGFSGMSLTQQFLNHKLEEHDEAYVKLAMKYHIGAKQEAYAGSTKTTWLPDTGILISGCQTNQTSTDFSPTGEESEAYGALSNCIQIIIKETGGQVSNKELVLKARKILKKQRFKQRPGLFEQLNGLRRDMGSSNIGLSGCIASQGKPAL